MSHYWPSPEYTQSTSEKFVFFAMTWCCSTGQSDYLKRKRYGSRESDGLFGQALRSVIAHTKPNLKTLYVWKQWMSTLWQIKKKCASQLEPLQHWVFKADTNIVLKSLTTTYRSTFLTIFSFIWSVVNQRPVSQNFHQTNCDFQRKTIWSHATFSTFQYWKQIPYLTKVSGICLAESGE